MTAPKHLYEIVDQYQAVMQAIEDAEGELTPELSAQLDAIPDAFKAKAERVGLYIRNLQSLAQAAELEAVRLKALAASRENAATRLKAYLLQNMQRMELKDVVTPLIKLRIQVNSRPSIHWPEGQEIPEAYRRVTVSLDGQAAYEAWKANGTLPEGFVVERGSHLRLS